MKVATMVGLFNIFLSLLIARAAGQCNFPSSFYGTWVSSSDGTWAVNSSHLLDYKVTGISGVSKLSFLCYQVQGSQYALQSTETVELFTGVFLKLYTCLDLRFSTTVKYAYYKNTDSGSPTASEITSQTNFSNICNKVNHDQPYSHHVALMSGNETLALTNCPATLFGTFHYDTCTDPGSNDTSMNACATRQQLVYNYTLCNTKQMFSAEGVLDCVYFVESGTITYLTVYNRDTTPPDDVNYYRFSCLAIEEQPDSTRKITTSPEQCEVNQSPSTITSPGQAIQFTPYYLCQITTTLPTTTSNTTNAVTNATSITISLDEAIVATSPSDSSSTDIVLIIGIVAAIIIVLIIVAICVLCCCILKRKRKKKVDDEEKAIAEDTDDQTTDERRNSERTSSQDEDKRSIDSGIGREPLSRGGTMVDGRQLDDKEQETETVEIVGEVEVDDKTDRPRSEQAEERTENRIEESTEATEDRTDNNNETERNVDEDNIRNALGVPIQCDEDDNLHDKTIIDVIAKGKETGHKEYTTVHGEKETVSRRSSMEKQSNVDEENVREHEDIVGETLKDESNEMSEDMESQITDSIEMTEDKDHGESRHEVIKDESRDTETVGSDDREDDVVDSKSLENKEEDDDKTDNERQARRLIGLTSDGEEIYATGTDQSDDDDSSVDDAEKERRRIEMKKHTVYTPAGPLTTVLVTRRDEERKRNKLVSKPKRQKIHKLAKHKSKLHNRKDSKEKHKSDTSSSDEGEEKRYETQEIPYIEQYRYKKKMDNKLNDEHYWSGPGEERNRLNRTEDTSSSVFSSSPILTESDVEERSSPVNHLVDKNGNIITITGHSNRDKRDADKYVNVIEMDHKGQASKEDTNDTRMERSQKGDEHITQKTHAKKILTGDARVINVKEHVNKHDPLQSADVSIGDKKTERKGELFENKSDDNGHDKHHQKLDNRSDTDSGVDDEELLDVVLTEEQQGMIVNALFDEDMNLRSEFDRDERGRIVRRLDNTVIFDPHTGRFTFRRRQGTVFRQPRLIRNKRGRPTGGYIEDEYGPKATERPLSTPEMTERQRSSRSRSSHRGADSRKSLCESPLHDKRSRCGSRNVGFRDVDAVSVKELEFHKRGKRDTGSGIRRKLKSRLFRKNRRRTDSSSAGSVQSRQPRTAWTSDTQTASTESEGDLNPVLYRGSRVGYATPRSLRSLDHDAQQWQCYREGLETDRRVLSGLQNETDPKRKLDNRRLGGSHSDLDDGQRYTDFNRVHTEREDMHDGSGRALRREPTYWTENGRLVVRERGCPEVQPVPLYKILRRPGTMADYEKRLQAFDESSRRLNVTTSSQRNDIPKSAPVPTQTRDSQLSEIQATNDGSSERLNDGNGGDRRVSYIDDFRLRQLLEELYKDKKYFDQFVEATEPESDVVIHTKGLAEHGRGYLLDRADYWEKRGPPPPRPPQTDIGWKMRRQQTVMESAKTSEHDSTMTLTPDIRPYTVPGYVDVKTPRENINTDNKENETIV